MYKPRVACFRPQMVFPERLLRVKAESPAEATKWHQAIEKAHREAVDGPAVQQRTVEAIKKVRLSVRVQLHECGVGCCTMRRSRHTHGACLILCPLPPCRTRSSQPSQLRQTAMMKQSPRSQPPKPARQPNQPPAGRPCYAPSPHPVEREHKATGPHLQGAAMAC